MTKLSQLSPQEAPPPYNPSRAVSFLFEYHNIAPGGGVGGGAGSITQGPNSPVFTWKAAYEHIQWYIDNQSGLPGSWLRVGAGLIDWPGEKTGPRPPICGYVGSENGYVADPVLGGCSMKLLRQVFMKLVASPRGGRATRQVTRAPASMPTRQITRTVAPKRGRVVRRRFR